MIKCIKSVAFLEAANIFESAKKAEAVAKLGIADKCPISQETADNAAICAVVCCCKNMPLPDSCEKAVFSAAETPPLGPSRFKSQVPYDMTKNPKPIMSKTDPSQPSKNWFYHPKDYVEGFVPGVGHVRIPDITIVKDAAKPVSAPGNIAKIVELKINDDSYRPQQQAAYERIAKENNCKLETFGNKSEGKDVDHVCPCPPDLKPLPVPNPVPVPVVAPRKAPALDWKAIGEGAIVVGLGLATVALIICPFDGPFGEAATGSLFLARLGVIL